MEKIERNRNRNVLITGITGFLGQNLANSLIKEGANVIGIVRDHVTHAKLSNCTLVYGNIEDYRLVRRIIYEYDIELCYHFAAQAIVAFGNDNPLETFETNIKGTWNVLEASRGCKGIKGLVIASSDKAYGEQEQLPYTEDQPLKGVNPYDVSKVCAEVIAMAYYKSFGLPVTTVRCGNLYGPGDYNWSRIIPGAIYNVLNGKPPVIRGDGKALRDYVYIDDAVAGYLKIGQSLLEGKIKGEAINLGTGKPHSVEQVIRKIIEVSGRKLNYQVLGNPANDEISKQILSSQKANNLLGWIPKTSWEKGIYQTFEWYRSVLESR
jgi:CDP-glucose 4,6-dehydratase